MEIVLALSPLGWVGFVFMLVMAVSALLLLWSAFTTDTQYDYDMATPLMNFGKILLAIICILVAVILYLTVI